MCEHTVLKYSNCNEAHKANSSECTVFKALKSEDNKLTLSYSVFCQYLLELVYLIKKSRWVYIEYTQHYIDWSLYEPKKCDLKAHYTKSAFINIASKTRLWKLITHDQLS